MVRCVLVVGVDKLVKWGFKSGMQCKFKIWKGFFCIWDNYSRLFFGCFQSAVADRTTFVCTFEENETCLFTNNESTDIVKKEMWGFEDGRGVVVDNTLRRGLSMHIRIIW